MVYHRNLWNYYVSGLLRGVLQGDYMRTGSLHKTVQQRTDGAIGRYYSIPEWRILVADFCHIENIMVFGGKSEIVPLPGGKVKKIVMALIPTRVSRFLTNRCRMGSFLVSILRKGE